MDDEDWWSEDVIEVDVTTAGHFAWGGSELDIWDEVLPKRLWESLDEVIGGQLRVV